MAYRGTSPDQHLYEDLVDVSVQQMAPRSRVA